MQFYTPLSACAIVIEKDARHRLIWFWPMAAAIIFCVSYFLFQGVYGQLLYASLLSSLPLAAWSYQELYTDFGKSEPLVTWHRNALYLYSKGKLIHQIAYEHLEHVEVVSGHHQLMFIAHTQKKVIHHRLDRVNRGQMLQIQRLARRLAAELKHRQSANDLPDELEKIRADVEGGRKLA